MRSSDICLSIKANRPRLWNLLCRQCIRLIGALKNFNIHFRFLLSLCVCVFSSMGEIDYLIVFRALVHKYNLLRIFGKRVCACVSVSEWVPVCLSECDLFVWDFRLILSIRLLLSLVIYLWRQNTFLLVEHDIGTRLKYQERLLVGWSFFLTISSWMWWRWWRWLTLLFLISPSGNAELYF